MPATKEDIGEVARNAIWRDVIKRETNVRYNDVMRAAEEIKARQRQERRERRNPHGMVYPRDFVYCPPGNVEVNPDNIEEGIFSPNMFCKK